MFYYLHYMLLFLYPLFFNLYFVSKMLIIKFYHLFGFFQITFQNHMIIYTTCYFFIILYLQFISKMLKIKILSCIRIFSDNLQEWRNVRSLSWPGQVLRPVLCLPYGCVFVRDTVCPRSSDRFCIVTYYIKWVTTSWTYSKIKRSRTNWPYERSNWPIIQERLKFHSFHLSVHAK